jgi:ERCC4-type nuclease
MLKLPNQRYTQNAMRSIVMNAVLEQRIITLIHHLSDEKLNQVIHFIEQQEQQAKPQHGLGTLLHAQFKALELTSVDFTPPERPIDEERVTF